MKPAKSIVLACVAAMLAPFAARAGLSHSGVISSSGRKHLQDGYVYTVPSDLTLKVSSGWNAMYLDDNSTAVLYIPVGVTLTVKGGVGVGTTGGGAGILVPSSSTLIITGGGTLVAEGGKGADGGGGGNGEDANVDGSGKPHDDWGRAGLGGKGGDGGGGAGAGIGGKGGAGGNGRDEIRKASNWHDTNGSWECKGYDGWSGYSGSNGGACGTIYVLGTVQVTATGGTKGTNGGSSGSTGEKDKEYWTLSYRAGGGGGGGGGGSGGAAHAIGGGGGGGGAGGGGGEGSRYRTTQGYTYRSANGGHGGGGSGGSSGGVSGGGSRTDGADGWFVGTGGNGGSGGNGGAVGSDGTVYKASAASVSGVSSTSRAETHSAIEYTITFDDGWRLSESLTAKFGYALPKGPTTSRYGCVFKGWYDRSDGTGMQYYDENGDSVVAVWTDAKNVTLYPKWEANSHEDVGEVSLTINEVPIVEGTDTSGAGWHYDSANGQISIFGIHSAYDISGKDLHGFARIQVLSNCTLRVSKTLEMAPGTRSDYSPININAGVTATLDVTTAVNDAAMCSLMGASGHTAIHVPAGANLTLRTTGVLNVMGGDDAADIGLDKGETSGGNIYVETYDNWTANIRPGHGLSADNGLLNSSGNGANFYSSATSNTVWSVRITELGADGNSTRMYLQRVNDDIHDDVLPNADGNAWLWMPNGGYEWAEELNASIKSNNLWVCFVADVHSAAEFFAPLHIEIDGEDIAHLTGNGWYATRTSTTTLVGESSRATLVITNVGPHVVTGYGNAGIDVNCDTSLTISNLELSVTSWEGKTALWMPPEKNITLNLTLAGANRLSSASGRAGIFVGPAHVINIDGDGSLQVQGGANAAGIGGCAKTAGTKRSGAININGGHITAIGGSNAAGIGGAQTSSTCGKISIAGGYITARGGQYAAGVGGGYTGRTEVEITGGTVFPTAGSKASAIGVGYKATTASAKDTFGIAAIYTSADKVSPAAMNQGGRAVFPVSFDVGKADCRVVELATNKQTIVCRDLWTNEKGMLTLWFESTGGDLHTMSITVADEDGNETKKSWGFKVDENGNYEFSNDVLTVDGELLVGGVGDEGSGWKYGDGVLRFESGSHTVSGCSTNGDIRIVVTGDDVGLSIEGLTLKTSSMDVSPFIVSNSCTITLRNENVIECVSYPNASSINRRGSQYAAAIEVPDGASLTIEGDGTLTAKGGLYGAGIGSNGMNQDAGSITINGGYIYASGTGYQNGGGAGIGGGDGGGVASILITGGYVDAVGGNNAAGIGGGAGNNIYLTSGTFRVTGGTVRAEKGKNHMGDTSAAFSDFVIGLGNTIDNTESVVIDGGSVRPKNATVWGNNPLPWPVNSNGVRLVFAMIEGLSVGDTVQLVDSLWPQYDGVDILADDDGAVCLWGEYTNAVRSIQVESSNIAGGSMTFDISAASNTIFKVSDDYEAPSNRVVNGETCWRVVVNSLPAKQRLAVTNIDRAYSRGTTVSDQTGVTYLYLPNGEYDFTVGGYAYHAYVNNDVTTATFTVGILVNGVEIAEGTLSGTVYGGNGWTYDGTKETLRLTAAADYVISGTNGARRVSVCVTRSGTKIRADRLVLVAAGEGAFYAESPGIEFEYKGGTVSTGSIPSRMTVSGGSLDATLLEPVAPSGAPAYRVTVGGFDRYSKVAIENLDGLDGYDTEGIWANEYGDVNLYLPDGDYFFRAVSGVSTNEMIAIVEGDEATALDFTPTGVFIDGRDAARLRGDGWRNEDGVVKLNSATNYVISGTNDGTAVTLYVEASGATLTLDNLVMANDDMLDSPIALPSGTKNTLYLELVGTNVIHGVDMGEAAMKLGDKSALIVSGDGRLEVVGANKQAGIGLAKSAIGTSASLTVNSGEIVATGGAYGAGIGGGDGQEGFNVFVYGGSVTATGGANGAGIGGGSGAGGGKVTVTNGMVSATGGVGGAGIGGGVNGISGCYTQKGGTVVARGTGGGADIGAGKDGGSGTGTGTYTTIVGGSLNSSTANITLQAKNATADNVYCVTIPTGRPNFDVGAVMSDWHGYLLTGAVTDDEGKLYIWLPNGTYSVNIGRVPFRAVVDNADTEAEQWSVGVEVNGEDVALQSGEGWTYDFASYKLSVFGDGCTISGSNTTDTAYILFTNDVSVTISNLVIETTSSSTMAPFSVLSNATVALTLGGINSLSCGATSVGGNGYAGMNVPYGSTLSITNLDTVISLPDLDNISVYTHTLYDIELDENGDPVIGPDGNVVTNDIIYVEEAVTNYVDTVVPSILCATGGLNSAGIGGGQYESHGTIEINGGIIYAAGCFGAGIGSGFFANSGGYAGNATTLRQGEIRINGGVVAAIGGQYGAGIGGGYNHSGGQIALSGGTVVAYGGLHASGIGGGTDAYGHTIEISGGVVEAYGGTRSAGIGGGSGGESDANTEQCKITISGGQVTAIGGTNGAGIGSGYQCSKGASVNITGGTVVASGTPDEYGSTPDDIGVGGYASSATTYPLKITDASVHALRHTNSSLYMSPAPSNGTERVWCVTVETASTNELVRVWCLEGYAEGVQVYVDEVGKIYLWLPNGTYIFAAGSRIFKVTVNGADTTAAKWLSGVTVDGVDVGHVEDDSKKWAYDLGTKTLYVAGDCVISGANAAGYVNILAGLTEADEGGGTGTVECSFTISNLFLRATSSSKASPITVKDGTVTVCLAGMNRLDATETDSFAGLNVVSPATLVITNLEENARLEVYSGEDAAAIGGNQNKESGVNSTTGTICIRGGIIYAEAQDSGAGIGSGYRGRSGSISISGGRVEAHGGEYHSIGGTWCGAGIGGGDNATVSAECKIAISGGTVEAYGGIRNDSKYAADIGAGYDGNSVYRIEITGGSVHPEADDESRYFNQSESHAAVPLDSGNHLVYKVTLDGFTPNAKTEIELDGYGTNDIYADSDGKVYLWLAPGSYNMKRNGVRYVVTVDSSGSSTVELAPIGVKVDGTDIKARNGSGWTYDVNTSTLALSGAHAVSGTNTLGEVKISASGAASILPSRLVVEAGEGNEVLSGAGTVTIANGTAYLKGNSSCPVKILGGSLKFDGTAAVAFSNDTAAVYCVTVSNLTADAEVPLTGLAGYGKDGIYADDDGCIYLWLPEGEHDMGMNGKQYVVTVTSDGSYTVELVKVGVMADGMDVANGSGPRWSYDYDAGVLVVSDSVTLSGTNTAGKVSIVAATADAFALTISNLCLKATANVAPIFVTNGVVTICLAGTNTIGVSYDCHAAAVGVGSAASLVVTNLAKSAYLEATGGGNFPAIGGNESGNIGNITIAGGTIVANGGYRAAAIGLMTTSDVPAEDPRTIRITGGRVYAVASGSSGNYGAGIGGASQTKVHGLTVSIEGGTVSATGPLTSGGNHGADIGNGQLLASRLQGEVTVRITGGSVITNAFGFTATGDTEQYSVNALGETNWCARISGFAANERADIELDGYGTNDIYADADGNVWLWLADGVYLYTTGGARHALKMEGGTSTIVDVPASYGVQVDGEDVVRLSGGAWAFDLFANALSLTGDVTLSGTNTAGEVKIVADADVTVSPSRLVLGVGSGEDVFSGAGTVTITNGTAELTGNVACPLKILGGSFKFDGLASVAVSNETAELFCVEVPGLTPDAAVAFSGLPPYYGTSGIYADADGKVYLWLPLEWDPSSITPQYLSAPRLGAGATHTFAANGYSYTVTIDPEVGSAVATKGDPLSLETIRIDNFVVADGYITISFTAKPATWLHGFHDLIEIRASETLPIPDTDDAILDLSGAELHLDGADAATLVVPLGERPASGFFKVEGRMRLD